MGVTDGQATSDGVAGTRRRVCRWGQFTPGGCDTLYNGQMKNGFIYPLIRGLVCVLWALNLVEYVKDLFAWMLSKIKRRELSVGETKIAKNIAIDSFLVAKWLFVFIAIWSSWTGLWAALVIWYLIASNLFTYFYHHVWGNGFALSDGTDSQRRRFINFLLALVFYIVCYAYLYQHQYSAVIAWPDDLVDTTNALYLSIANAFTLTYGGFSPLSQTARMLFASELINTFFFFAIIIVNSIPIGQSKGK